MPFTLIQDEFSKIVVVPSPALLEQTKVKSNQSAPEPTPEGVSKPPCEKSSAANRKKKCSSCGVIQHVNNFAKHSTSSDGKASICNDCRNKRNDNRRRNDPDARLKHMISTRCLTQFPHYPDLTRKLETHLGYTIRELRKQLDTQCKRDFGMTMLKCTESGEYHIDHIKPLSSYNCKEPGDNEFKACWAKDNLVMITAEENMAKGAKH